MRCRTSSVVRAGASLALVATIIVPGYSASASARREEKKPTTVVPQVEWTGDYQTGNFQQWKALEETSTTGATIVTAPARAGYTYTARYVVNPGDHTNSLLSERAEASASQAQSGGYEGNDEWYGWSTFFPTNLNAPPNKTSIFTQWHQTKALISESCPPNLAFQVDARTSPTTLNIRARGGLLSSCVPGSDLSWNIGPLVFDEWHDFLVHVHWSSDASQGYLEVWMDGIQVVPRTYTATLYSGQGVYLKQGFYRPSYSLTSTIFQTATKRMTGPSSSV